MGQEAGWRAVATLYHAFFTALLLSVASRRSHEAAGRLSRLVFRRQHEAKFLSSFRKLGLDGLPHAVAAARYHYLSNRIGGVGVEYVEESARKAWVRFTHPRWLYEGAALAGVPVEVSRGFLEGWYAQNGVSLENPRLGFVCTSEDMTGQSGLAGYFVEEERALAPEERLRFRPGELAPRFEPAAAPALDAAEWPAERLARANRNYAMEYVRTALPAMAELFGPLEAAWLAGAAAELVGRQYYRETRRLLALPAEQGGAEGFALWLAAMAAAEDDPATVERDGEAWSVRRGGWRPMRGQEAQPDCVFDAWNGLWRGALAVHDRFLALEVVGRRDWGDPAIVWRIRRRGPVASGEAS